MSGIAHRRPEVKRKALIVEDTPDAQAALAALLAAEDFEVVAIAATEHQAIEWLEQNEGGWDVVIIDLLLAEGSGFTVLRRCATSPQAGQVVVFSGFVSDTVRERCVALGAGAVFPKSEAVQLAQYLRGVPRRPEADAQQP
jgi:two-component system OmpR family response regulator